MYAFCMICFCVGVLYTIVSFCLNDIFRVFNPDTKFKLKGAFAFIRPSMIAAFLIGFGGLGTWLSQLAYALPLVALIPMSLIAGFTIAFVLYRTAFAIRTKNPNTVNKAKNQPVSR